MRLALVLTLGAVFACFPVGAQTWTSAGGNGRALYDGDTSSIAKHRLGIKMWLRTTYKEPQESTVLHPTKFVKQTYQSTLSLFVFDCSERLMGTLQSLEYSEPDGAGETVSSWNKPSPTMSDVVPGSFGANWLDAVCARARKLQLVK